MAFLIDNALDSGLSWITTNGDTLDICSQAPATYTEATTTYSLGTAAVTIASPSDKSGGGREVIIPAVASQSVTGTGTSTHWAITDGASTLIAWGLLSASTSIVAGNTFTTNAFAIGYSDVA
jgi:hypothetical protein